MPPRAKPKAVYIYPLQIWLSSATIGPILWFFSPDVSDHSVLTFGEFYGYALAIGLMFSFPSFLLLWLAIAYVNRRTWRVLSKKILIAGCAVVLGIAPLTMLIDWRQSILQEHNLAFMVAYLGPLLVAIFLFRWPKKLDN